MHPSDSYRIVHIAPRLRYGAGRYLLDTAIAQQSSTAEIARIHLFIETPPIRRSSLVIVQEQCQAQRARWFARLFDAFGLFSRLPGSRIRRALHHMV